MAVHSGERKRTYHALDGLRGIAALLVVLYHAAFVAGADLVPNGYLAVDLFFAISGFVIAHAYDERLRDGLGVGRFALMRVLRFWPLYLLGLLLGLAVKMSYAALDHPLQMAPWKMWTAFLFNGAFLPAPFQTYGNTLFPLNPVAWSLFFELVVNILYACFLPLLSRRVVMGITVLAGAGFAVAAWTEGTTNIGWASTQIWAGMARTIFSFGAGVWLCRANPRLPEVPFLALAAAVLLCLALPLAETVRTFATIGFILCLSPLIVALATRSAVPRWAVGPAAWLGLISYALYAVHRPLLSLAHLANERVGAPGLLVAALFMVAVCILCAWLDRRFDAPVRRYLNARLGLARRELKPA